MVGELIKGRREGRDYVSVFRVYYVIVLCVNYVFMHYLEVRRNKHLTHFLLLPARVGHLMLYFTRSRRAASHFSNQNFSSQPLTIRPCSKAAVISSVAPSSLILAATVS
jgi:hypothetical protein